MKQILMIIGFLSLISCAKKDNLTKNEKELLKTIGFETELISKLKEKTNSEIKQLSAIDEETGEMLTNKYNGVFLLSSEKLSVDLVRSMKNEFRDDGYLIFVMDTENDEKSIAIIKGKDDIEILKYRRTDGINHNLENKDIISKISKWKNQYGLVVMGCSRDWVHIEFDNLPNNLEEFAKEVYKFCPDSVDQGVGDIEKLQMYIEQMNGIWLWWD